MVALELQPVIASSTRSPRSHQVTLERRQVAGKQLRFNWDENEAAASESKVKATASHATSLPGSRSTPVSNPISVPKSESSTGGGSQLNPAPRASRIGDTTKLGMVMFRLLKRYGITDEEIIEGLSLPALG